MSPVFAERGRLSIDSHERAARVIPFGTPSRYRGHNDVMMASATGSRLRDVEGNTYVDLVSALGPMLHGNSPAPVVDAVRGALDSGLQFSAPHVAEAALAERILESLTWADRLVFANSGSEAVHQALRIARATTGRRIVVKFEGHYHGWIDPMFVNTGSAAPFGELPGSRRLESGSPASPEPHGVVVADWDDPAAFARVMGEIGSHVAAVIVEPAAATLGNRLPTLERLESIRDVAHSHGALMIVDEVVTGFRYARGGLCSVLGFDPDLATYAKALGSGLPIALVAGTESAFAPLLDGSLSTLGTYNASPVGVAAAAAVLDMCDEDPGLFARVAKTGARIRDLIRDAASAASLPVSITHCSSVLQLLVGTHESPTSYAEYAAADKIATARVSRRLLEYGVYTLPRGLLFASTAIDETDLRALSDAFTRAFADEAVAHAQPPSIRNR